MWDNYILLVKSKNNMQSNQDPLVKRPVGERKYKAQSLKWKKKWRMISLACLFSKTQNEKMTANLVNESWFLLSKKAFGNFPHFFLPGSVSWKLGRLCADHLKRRVQSIWALFSSFDTELKCLISDSSRKPVGWSLWSKTHVHTAKDWSYSFKGHKSFLQVCQPHCRRKGINSWDYSSSCTSPSLSWPGQKAIHFLKWS